MTFTITLHSRYCYVKLFERNFNRRHEAVLQSQLDVSQHIEYNIDTEIHRLSQELCVFVFAPGSDLSVVEEWSSRGEALERHAEQAAHQRGTVARPQSLITRTWSRPDPITYNL